MDTFTITGYAKATDTATVSFTVDGTTYTGLKIQGIPKDTVEAVATYIRGYADAYIAGKTVEANAQLDISNEVKALLNTPTEF